MCIYIYLIVSFSDFKSIRCFAHYGIRRGGLGCCSLYDSCISLTQIKEFPKV